MQTTPFAWALAAALALGCGSAMTDPEIERSVASRLASDANLRGYPIEVVSLGGEVLLVGHVESHDHRVRAAAIAERVRGVHFVRNHLRVARPHVAASDPSALGRPGQPRVSALP